MPTKIETKAAGFTAVEMGIIQHGDMLGGDLGSRVARALEAPIGEQGVGVKALVQEWVKDWWQCGCTDAGCSSRHAERNAVLDDIEETLLPRILSALSPERKEPGDVPEGCLNVGHQVRKPVGYPYPGEVRAVFKTRAGLVRYVVEATGEDYAGMLHIFSPGQLELPATSGQPT